MGWFNKKEEGDEKKEALQKDTPSLPKLPELPELPKIKEDREESIHRLPSFPTNSFGEKFSQNIIKEAIKGKPRKEHDYVPEEKKGEGVFEADDFAPPKKMQMMQKPLTKPIKKGFRFPKTKELEPKEDLDFEIGVEEPAEFEASEEPVFEAEPTDFKPEPITSRKEPVFIRIDKFEEALKTFQKTKKEILEIEKALKDIGAVREDEDKELESWQNDIIKVKEQIENIDRDIFSRIE